MFSILKTVNRFVVENLVSSWSQSTATRKKADYFLCAVKRCERCTSKGLKRLGSKGLEKRVSVFVFARLKVRVSV